MTSNDNFVTVELNEKIIALQTEMNQRFDKLENLVAAEIRVNEVSHSYLQTSIYWGFAIMGVVIALVGLIVAIIALNLNKKPEKKSDWSERDLRALMRDEIAMSRNAISVGE